MNSRSEIRNLPDRVSGRPNRFCKDRIHAEKVLKKRAGQSAARCLLCFRSMEEERNLSWILYGENLLCFECEQKTGIHRPLQLPVFFSKKNRIRSFLSEYPPKKRCRYKQPVRSADQNLRNVKMKLSCRNRKKKSGVQREKIIWIEIDERERSEPEHFHPVSEDRQKETLRSDSYRIPLVSLFEPSEDFLNLWDQYSNRYDYVLAPVFLQFCDDLRKMLKKSDCLAGWTRSERRSKTGWDPLAEVFRFYGISVHFLKSEDPGGSAVLPAADLFARAADPENRKAHARRTRIGKKRRKVLLFESSLNLSLIRQQISEIRVQIPGFLPDLILCLY